MDRSISNCETYYDYHYVYPPQDPGPGAWRVGRDVKYPSYSSDINSRRSGYQWKTHPNSVYAPLNENAEASLKYRKYINDASGMPTYWYRHTIEPSYEWMFEESVAYPGNSYPMRAGPMSNYTSTDYPGGTINDTLVLAYNAR